MPLRALSRSGDVRFDRGTFDVRNWEVRLRPKNERVGVVDDVLVDEHGRSCYLDVDLADTDRHVLLPCGQIDADRNENVIYLSGLRKDRLTQVPEYRHEPASVDEDYERRVSTVYDEAYTDEGFYDRPDYATTAWSGREAAERGGKLARLDRLEDVDVASGSPDPRGWSVIGADGRELGRIEHLIGDTSAMKVRYLTMKVDKKLDKNRREILIPAGHVDLDRSSKTAHVDALDERRVLEIPRYEGGEIRREQETALMKAYEGGYTGPRRYEHPRYRDDRLYRAAEETRGEARRDEDVGGEVVVRRRPRKETTS